MRRADVERQRGAGVILRPRLSVHRVSPYAGRMNSRTGWVLAACCWVLVAGCEGGTQDNAGSEASDVQASTAATATGTEAVWDIDPKQPPSPTESAFTALVTRVDCNNGETGAVLQPEVVEGEQEVVVAFTVSLPSEGARACPANKPTPYTVTLSAPLGDRKLLDSSCPIVMPAGCAEDGKRWPGDG